MLEDLLLKVCIVHGRNVHLCCCQNTDSEEEVQSVKKTKKPSEKKAATPELGKVLKQHPVVYVSETGNGNVTLHVQLYCAVRLHYGVVGLMYS